MRVMRAMEASHASHVKKIVKKNSLSCTEPIYTNDDKTRKVFFTRIESDEMDTLDLALAIPDKSEGSAFLQHRNPSSRMVDYEVCHFKK